jgi:hypothetical protein
LFVADQVQEDDKQAHDDCAHNQMMITAPRPTAARRIAAKPFRVIRYETRAVCVAPSLIREGRPSAQDNARQL